MFSIQLFPESSRGILRLPLADHRPDPISPDFIDDVHFRLSHDDLRWPIWARKGSGTIHWISRCHRLPWVSGFGQLSKKNRDPNSRDRERSWKEAHWKTYPVYPNYGELSVRLGVRFNCMMDTSTTEEIATETAYVMVGIENYDKRHEGRRTGDHFGRNEMGHHHSLVSRLLCVHKHRLQDILYCVVNKLHCPEWCKPADRRTNGSPFVSWDKGSIVTTRICAHVAFRQVRWKRKADTKFPPVRAN